MYIIKRSTVNSHTKSLYSKYAVVCCVVSVETLSLILPYKHAAECCRLSWSSWLTVACNARELKAGTHTHTSRQYRPTVSDDVGRCWLVSAETSRYYSTLSADAVPRQASKESNERENKYLLLLVYVCDCEILYFIPHTVSAVGFVRCRMSKTTADIDSR